MRIIFLICPVRNVDTVTQSAIYDYVQELERQGCRVYWPLRDTDQGDTIGLRICSANKDALAAATEVHVWYDPQSQGSLFDLGMAFMADKRIVCVNDVQPTDGKSFANLLLALQG